MTSFFSRSASKAQHTPPVCRSKSAEAARVIVPTWQRALVALNLNAPSNCSGAQIDLDGWLTRDNPFSNWSRSWNLNDLVLLQLQIQATLAYQPSDILVTLQPAPGAPPFTPCSFNASATPQMFSHTLWGGRAPLLSTIWGQGGTITLRFDGDAPS